MNIPTNLNSYQTGQRAQELAALAENISALEQEIQMIRKSAREHVNNAALNIAFIANLIFDEVLCNYITDISLNNYINRLVPNNYNPMTAIYTIALITMVKNLALTMWDIKKKESKLAELEVLKEKYNQDLLVLS